MTLRVLGAIVLLVAVAVVAVFSSLSSGAGQQFNTVTTTSFVTVNSYSTETVGFSTETATGTSTFLAVTDTVSGTGRHCFYDDGMLNIQPGTVAVTGTIGPPNTPIDFFIMTQAQFNSFAGGPCGSMYRAAVVQQTNIISTYNLDWTDPQPGSYYIVVFDESPGIDFRVPITILVTGPQEMMMPITSVLTGEETLANTYVTSVQAPQGFVSPWTLGIAAVVVIIVLVAAILVYNKKKVRSQRQKAPEPPSQPPIPEAKKIEPVAPKPVETAPTTGKQFCIECGAELRVGSKFCNKCGARQPPP